MTAATVHVLEIPNWLVVALLDRIENAKKVGPFLAFNTLTFRRGEHVRSQIYR